MKKNKNRINYLPGIMLLFALLIFEGVGFSEEFLQGSSSDTVSIIWDTDMQWDWDDAGALAVLNAMADAGEAKILGIGSSTRGEAGKWNPHTIDAINTYYKRPDIPIGKSLSGPSLGDMYGQWISTHGFTYELAPGQVWDNVVELYRKLLSEQPDTSVVIVTVGYTSNVKDLLMSEPDQYSDLDGKALVAKKVKFWSCMGGRYPGSGTEANFQDWHGHTKYAIENFPRPILGTSSEAGNVSSAGSSLELTPLTNPVRAIYRKRLDEQGYPNTFSHSTWDLIATLVAVRDPAQYFDLTSSGTNVITLDASNKTYNKWEPSPDKGYRYLIQTDPRNVSAVLDELIGRAPALAGHELNVTIIGNGGVSTTGGSFESDSVVILTATPGICYEFSNWSGDLTGNLNPAVIILDKNKSVTAEFTKITDCTGPDLIAHWPLNESSGLVAEDLTDNNFDLELIHTDDSNWDTDAVKGQHLKLNGTDEYGVLSTVATNELQLGAFSLALFIKMEVGSVTRWCRIAGINNAYGYNINASGELGMWNNYGDNKWHGSYGDNASLADGQWHHIAITHDDNEGNIFYLDGESVFTQNWTDGTGNAIVYPGENLFKIGANDEGNNLPAHLQDIRVYNRVLSQPEVEDIMNGTETGITFDKSQDTFELLTYPNPFVSSTKITYKLDKSSDVDLVVFDISGKEISVLVNQNQQAGVYQFEWNGKKYPPGIYYCRFSSGNYQVTNELVLMKYLP